ncbi:hypothetical protein [Haliscomenobacter sp.]|uniref:hypothetical protein n=1 Tax=Haliscomenobacter sp. TaxID=2717303 RepID=UPI003BABA399
MMNFPIYKSSNLTQPLPRQCVTLAAEVVFGNPQAACTGNGLCRIIVLPQTLTSHCPLQLKGLLIFDPALQCWGLCFSTSFISQKLWDTCFAHGHFELPQPFMATLPPVPNHDLPPLTILEGTYPLNVYKGFMFIWFH